MCIEPTARDIDHAWSVNITSKALINGFEVRLTFSENSILNIGQCSWVEFINLSQRQVKELLAAEPKFKDYFHEGVEEYIGKEVPEEIVNYSGHKDEVIL